MQTPESRGRMADTRSKAKRYPTDLSDAEWSLIEPLMPPPARRGRLREAELREVVNALRYLVRSGCGWEMLPTDFQPWEAVHWWYRVLMRRFLFSTLHDMALMLERERAGREASSTAAPSPIKSGASRSVKAPQ